MQFFQDKKYGKTKLGKQRYFCLKCTKTFTIRRKKLKSKVINEYISGKQTYAQIKSKFGYTHKTIQKQIDLIKLNYPSITPQYIVLGMDTSFFGELTVTLIRDVTNKKNLIWQFGHSEKRSTYQYLYDQLIKAGINPLGISVDGRSYFFGMFNDVPVQMCHFHMAKILAKYLTRNPRLEVNKELWKIWHQRDIHRPETFRVALKLWFEQYHKELEEIYVDRYGNKQFVKIRTRKAYFSLLRFTPWLFTYQTNRWIPKTNNSLEGTFSQIKKKINVHPGLSVGRKMKLIHYLFMGKQQHFFPYRPINTYILSVQSHKY